MSEKEEKRPSYDDVLEALQRLEKENERLRKENEKLRGLLEELKRKGKRQAAPFSKGDPSQDPKRPGRKAGREYGPKAFRNPPNRVDEIFDAPLPSCCAFCGGGVEFVEVQKQYQAEIPRKVMWRQFNVAIGRCKTCRKRVQGRHPFQTSNALGAAASQIGPDAQALVVQMKNEVGIPYGKICRLFQVAFGISLTRGGAAQICLRTAGRCGDLYKQFFLAVRKSPIVYPDETGWRVGGVLQWLWTFVTKNVTLYLIRPSRGGEVPEEVFGIDYDGTIGHDGWAPYDRFVEASHQQCLAHLLRRCNELLEVASRGAVRFPGQVKDLLKDALALRDRWDARGISPCGLSIAKGKLESRLDRLLTWTRSNKDNERFAKHLDRHRDQIFTFLKEPEVEATNWPAEQSLRPPITTRKVWGGNRTWAGAQAQEVNSSVLRTCLQQGRNGVDFLSKMLRADCPRKRPRLRLPVPEPG